jgi:hypothetical protein
MENKVSNDIEGNKFIEFEVALVGLSKIHT